MFLRFKNVDTKYDINGASYSAIDIDYIKAFARDDNAPRDNEGNFQSPDEGPAEAIARMLMSGGREIKNMSEKKPAEDRSQYLMLVMNDDKHVYTGSNFDETLATLREYGLFIDL
jgi:hypothetical protein